MKSVLRRPVAVSVVAVVGILVIGTSVVLGATVATNGRSVTAVRTKTADDTSYSSSGTPTDVAGMTLSVDVPAGQQAMFVTTFSAETTCTGTATFTRCLIQVLLDGAPARPGTVSFDATDATPNVAPWTAKSMQFVIGPAGPGTHYIKVQRWSDPSTTFGVRARTLTVLRSQV